MPPGNDQVGQCTNDREDQNPEHPADPPPGTEVASADQFDDDGDPQDRRRDDHEADE
jgi:hypothetical protein